MVAAVSLLLAILFVPLIEVFLFIQVGSEIGALPTVALCVLTAVAGAAMLRHQGLKALTEARARLNRNEAPVDQVFDGLFLIECFFFAIVFYDHFAIANNRIKGSAKFVTHIS